MQAPFKCASMLGHRLRVDKHKDVTHTHTHSLLDTFKARCCLKPQYFSLSAQKIAILQCFCDSIHIHRYTTSKSPLCHIHYAVQTGLQKIKKEKNKKIKIKIKLPKCLSFGLTNTSVVVVPLETTKYRSKDKHITSAGIK